VSGNNLDANVIAHENVTSAHNSQKVKTVSGCVREKSNTKHIKMPLNNEIETLKILFSVIT